MHNDAGILKKQIGIGNLMACGAREFYRDGSSTIGFRVGSKRGEKSVIKVKLEEDDTYTVTLYVMNMKTYAMQTKAVEGVYCDNIGEVVRSLGDR